MTAIDDKYAALARSGLNLGSPTSPEGDAAGGGRYRHYQQGSIYWTAQTGAHELHGAIHAEYSALGWERTVLGYPTTDETGTPDGVGRFNHFQGGSIYWTPSTGAHEVHGNIRATWSNLGWERSWLGYPVSDETQRFSDAYRTSSFQHGMLYWDPLDPAVAFPLAPQQASLLVVAPAAFIEALRPLVTHKRATRMPAFLIEIDQIVRGSPGRDDAEKLKRAIFDAVSQLQVRYVMLAGDASLIPVRYRRTSHVEATDTTWSDAWYTAADLYYGNLYLRHVASGDFATPDLASGYNSWDANGDGFYDEHHWGVDSVTFNPDHVDGCPDIAVARVPAHTVAQIETYVTKVIAYETATVPRTRGTIGFLIDRNYGGADALADRIIADSGLQRAFSVDRVAPGYGPAEQPPTGFSRGTAPEVQNAAWDGPFLVYVGHGATQSWDLAEMVGTQSVGVDSTDVGTYANENLPVVVSIGCSTGEWVTAAPDHVVPGDSGPVYRGTDGLNHRFRVTGSQVTDTPDGHPDLARTWTVPPRVAIPPPNAYDLDRPSPTFGVAWLFNPHGGGIAFCGETTVAQDNWGADLATGLFRGWNGPGTVLGDMWLAGGRYYWKMHATSEDPIGAPRCYLTYMTLMGDPSLRIHGSTPARWVHPDPVLFPPKPIPVGDPAPRTVVKTHGPLVPNARSSTK